MNKLITFAKSIEDFRLDRKKLHSVENIVFITILAVICGAQDWEEIEDFGNARKDFFSKHLNLINGIPSHDTFNRFFSLFNPKKFQTIFLDFLKELIGFELTDNQVAIDGKSIRGSKNKAGSMVHLLHAYVVEAQCFLGQEKVNDKSNEITAIPKLLEVLDLQNAIVSIDAIGCQKEIAEQIIAKQADYFLAVKQNQKTWYEDLECAFKVYQPTAENFYCIEELNGSRIEKRSCKVMSDLSHLSQENDWKSIKNLIKIETQTYHKSSQKLINDCKYYITSKVDTAQKYLQYSRNHWQVENNLHWSLDVIFQEDGSRKRNNYVVENFSIILKLILKILQQKQQQNKKISIKRMRKMAAWDLEYLLSLLNF